MSTASMTASVLDRELFAAARSGDEGAFRRIVETHHGELRAHCYRMLGSVHDAEDALQDALLRAWRGLPRFEGRSSLRTWLYRIATNACLDLVARRPKRVLPIDHGPATDPRDGPGEPLVESVWMEPYPDETLALADGRAAPEASYERRESMELAFIAALQHLPPRQRAALILCEVLGFSAREAAESLDSTPASVNSALQRARRGVEDHLPAHSQQATLRTLGDARLREVVQGYVEAMERGDVDAVVAMLTKDATWSMPPLASWFSGRTGIAAFLAAGPLSGEWRWRHVPTRASGQAAVGCYTWSAEAARFDPFCIDVLTLHGARIQAVTAFVVRTTAGRDRGAFARWPAEPAEGSRAAALFERFGLPDQLDGSAQR